jgi:thymidylate synthase (FAD)
LDKQMKVTLLAITKPTLAAEQLGITDPDLMIEYAARLCYNSTDKLGKAPGFVMARIREGHEDVIEHCSASFLVEGISRTATHQLVRHRIASFSQESQRYVDQRKLDDDLVVVPDSIYYDDNAMFYFKGLVDHSLEVYDELRNLGIPKEDARFVLPEGAKSRLVVSMNFRSWRHFLWLRLDKAAQWEIREAAHEILKVLYQEAPKTFQDIRDKYP